MASLANHDNAIWQTDVAMGYGSIGVVLAQQGKATQAVHALNEGRAIIVRLVGQSPDNAQLPKDLAAFDAEIAKLEEASASEIGAVPQQAAQ